MGGRGSRTTGRSNKRSRVITAKEWANVSKNIAHSICGFYEKNNITDEEVRKALTR